VSSILSFCIFSLITKANQLVARRWFEQVQNMACIITDRPYSKYQEGRRPIIKLKKLIQTSDTTSDAVYLGSEPEATDTAGVQMCQTATSIMARAVLNCHQFDPKPRPPTLHTSTGTHQTKNERRENRGVKLV
jgi:hypothetical protein